VSEHCAASTAAPSAEAFFSRPRFLPWVTTQADLRDEFAAL
jgi:hypothetical protein